jgi:alkanesulfonate monooxygenase SsuD/methylene tetrahydromethanopterin reductase-like flavin-dependent oxidoreductase (luciferase family)
MTATLVGADEADVRRRVERLAERRGVDADDMLSGARASGIVGTVDEVVERLKAYEAAGVQRVMMQHLLHDDVEMLELVGREVIPRVS